MYEENRTTANSPVIFSSCNPIDSGCNPKWNVSCSYLQLAGSLTLRIGCFFTIPSHGCVFFRCFTHMNEWWDGIDLPGIWTAWLKGSNLFLCFLGCHVWHFPRNIGNVKSSQLTNSYFSEGFKQPPTSLYPSKIHGPCVVFLSCNGNEPRHRFADMSGFPLASYEPYGPYGCWSILDQVSRYRLVMFFIVQRPAHFVDCHGVSPKFHRSGVIVWVIWKYAGVLLRGKVVPHS